MYEFQDDGVRWLQSYDRAYLGDEAGLGKSRQLLLACDDGPTLIVAPAMVLQGGVWTDEVAKWRPELSKHVVQRSYHGLVRKRYSKTQSGATSVQFTGDLDPELNKPWANVIYDEAHYLKGRDTKWTSAAYQANRLAGRVDLASGTPIPNWAHELFTTLCMLFPDQAKRGGRLGSYWRWAGEWFIVGPKYSKSGRLVSQYNVDGQLKACTPACTLRAPSDPCEHWTEFHRANFQGRFLQRLRDDVLKNLPPLTVQEIVLPMGDEQRKLYNELKEQFVTWVAETGAQVVAWNQAAQHQKLMMATTGIPSVDPDATRGSAKLDMLETLLSGRSQPALVLCYFNNTAQAIGELCDRLKLRWVPIGGRTSPSDRLAAVRGFQAGEYDVLVGSIEVVAEGLTLTRADQTIFVERHWRPSRNEQALRRVHRIGQTRPVSAIHLYTDKTLDLVQRDVLRDKTDLQLRALSPHQLLAAL